MSAPAARGLRSQMEEERPADQTEGDARCGYSYSVSASSERQRWIIYVTFGHAAASLSNPILPADDERDNLVNVLPHAQFAGNWIYEFLPALSRGNPNGVPTPALRAELTTVEVTLNGASAFETALAAEPKPCRDPGRARRSGASGKAQWRDREVERGDADPAAHHAGERHSRRFAMSIGSVRTKVETLRALFC